MAAVSVDPTLVRASAAATITNGGLFGDTITAGQVGYRDATASQKFKLADADGAGAIAVPYGISLNGGANGQPCALVVKDPAFVPGFTALAGDTVYLMDTPGAMTVTRADLEAGDTITVLGVMVTTTVMNLNITTGGAQAA